MNIESHLFTSLMFSVSFFTDDWVMFDDDKVHPVTSEDVLKLSGGGELLQ